jgi:hypothetical protein
MTQNVISANGQVLHQLCLQLQATKQFKTKISSHREFPDGSAITSMVARNKDRGISVLGDYFHHTSQHNHTPRIRISTKIRTRASGYRTLHQEYLNINDQNMIPAIVQKAVAALSYEPLDPANLPTPWQFGTDRFQANKVENTGWAGGGNRYKSIRMELNAVIYQVAVIGLVTIGRDGIISGEGISEPNATCWYLLDCVGFQGATFNLVSDGEVFYPTNRITNNMATIRLANGTGKDTADLRKTGLVDKEIVNAAIEAWVKVMVQS